jgi:hypothetical protein
MSTMADETLAFSVAEATMQEWLAAMLLARLEPMPPCPQQLPPHPVHFRQAFVQPATRVAPARASSRPTRPAAARNGFVAGARAVYWLSLAAALAVTLIF